jgi:hypothetical protein
MEDVHYNIGLAIQQNKVSADHHMSAVRRRGRQLPFELFRTGLETFLESRGKRPAANELLFQAGR